MGTKSIMRILLIVLEAFLGLTAQAGGIGLLAGTSRPPLALLQGSPFSSYTIPGLVLLVIVGGSALAATILLLRQHTVGTLVSMVAGAMIVGFEMVEVLVVGSDPGVARTLQVFYFTLGLVIVVLSGGLWVTAHAMQSRNS